MLLMWHWEESETESGMSWLTSWCRRCKLCDVYCCRQDRIIKTTSSVCRWTPPTTSDRSYSRTNLWIEQYSPWGNLSPQRSYDVTTDERQWWREFITVTFQSFSMFSTVLHAGTLQNLATKDQLNWLKKLCCLLKSSGKKTSINVRQAGMFFWLLHNDAGQPLSLQAVKNELFPVPLYRWQRWMVHYTQETSQYLLPY